MRKAAKQSAGPEAEPLNQEHAAALRSLNLRHGFFMLSLLEDSSPHRGYYRSTQSRLAPHWQLAMQVFGELAGADVISLHQTASFEGPQPWFSPEYGAEQLWSANPRYGVPLSRTVLWNHVIELTLSPDGCDELFTLWRELAISEAAGYLAAELGEHRFDESWATGAVPSLDRALTRMSVAQVFYFCWMAVRETASRYLRYPSSAHTLADGLVDYIQQRIERALAEKWTIREWNYASRRVQSPLARIFAGDLTGLGAAYLTSIPSRDVLAAARAFPSAAPRSYGRVRRTVRRVAL